MEIEGSRREVTRNEGKTNEGKTNEGERNKVEGEEGGKRGRTKEAGAKRRSVCARGVGLQMHQGKIVGIAEEGSRTGSETDRHSRE